MTKRGTPPKNVDKKGDPAFHRPRGFRCNVVVGINPTAQQDVCVRTGNISDPRTASVCFIQEEPHNIPCVLNGGGRIQVIGTCPVTTDCIVGMSYKTSTTTTTVVTAVLVPKMQQVKCSVNNGMYTVALLHARTAVVVVVDARNEVAGWYQLLIQSVGISRTMRYEYT